MNALWSLINLLVFIQIVICRDFYIGMFRRNDFLVAQDVIYKAPAPFGSTTASYGRLFKCPITYFRVVDRLGMGRGPITTIVRGGLKKKFIAVRIKSTYGLPVSVNIYVGCENKKPSTFRTTLWTTLTSAHPTTTEPESDSASDVGDDNDETTTDGATTAGENITENDEATTTDGTDDDSTIPENGNDITPTGIEETSATDTVAADTVTSEDAEAQSTTADPASTAEEPS